MSVPGVGEEGEGEGEKEGEGERMKKSPSLAHPPFWLAVSAAG